MLKTKIWGRPNLGDMIMYSLGRILMVTSGVRLVYILVIESIYI
jgi:hypothetical protein